MAPLRLVDGFVLGHAFTDHSPGHALRTQEVVLWISNDKCGVLGIDFESRVRKGHDRLRAEVEKV